MKVHLQTEESVRLVSHVSVHDPRFDHQPLRVVSLRPVERLHQAGCANLHRVKRVEIQPEHLSEFLVIINLRFKETFISQRNLIEMTFNLFFYSIKTFFVAVFHEKKIVKEPD